MQISPRQHASILKEYRAFMHKMLNPIRPNISPEDMDELESSCQYATIRAVENYDEAHEGGATCKTVVRKYITVEIAKYFKKRTTRKALFNSNTISMFTPIGNTGHPITLGDFIEAKAQGCLDENIQINEAIASIQKKRDRDIIDRIRKGETEISIGSEYGLSRQRIGQIKQSGVMEMSENVGRRKQ